MQHLDGGGGGLLLKQKQACTTGLYDTIECCNMCNSSLAVKTQAACFGLTKQKIKALL